MIISLTLITWGFPLSIPSSLGASGDIIQTTCLTCNWTGQLLNRLSKLYLYDRRCNCVLPTSSGGLSGTEGTDNRQSPGPVSWVSSLWLVSRISALDLAVRFTRYCLIINATHYLARHLFFKFTRLLVGWHGLTSHLLPPDLLATWKHHRLHLKSQCLSCSPTEWL